MRMAFKPTPAPPAATTSAAAPPATAAASASAAAGASDEATNGKLSLAKGGGGAMFANDADFTARYSLESLFSTAWLDSPAPPAAVDPAGGAAAAAAAGAGAKAVTVAGAAPEVHVTVGTGGGGGGSSSGRHVVTRREAVWRVFTTHWCVGGLQHVLHGRAGSVAVIMRTACPCVSLGPARSHPIPF